MCYYVIFNMSLTRIDRFIDLIETGSKIVDSI